MSGDAQISRLKPGRRTDIRRENERAILEAAEKVFAEAGFGGATMQLIADMAGLPKANLHYYFATKEDLYRRVVQQIFEIWLRRRRQLRQCAGPGRRDRRLYRRQDGHLAPPSRMARRSGRPR